MERVSPLTPVTQPPLPQPLPSSTTVTELAKKFIPIDFQSFQYLPQGIFKGQIVTSEDGNTLLEVRIDEPAILSEESAVYGLPTFVKQATDIHQAKFIIHSLKEAILYFHMGIASSHLDLSHFQNLKSLEDITMTEETYKQIQQLSYPQTGTWISSCCVDFWQKLDAEKMQILAQQTLNAQLIHSQQSLPPAKPVDLDLEQKILSKATRKFQIKAGKHAAILITTVVKNDKQLSFQFVDLQIENKSVINSSLPLMEKFYLYRNAFMRFFQYSDRYPLPKGPQDTEQSYAQNLSFKLLIQTTSPELMNILWRLGLAPQGTKEKIGQAYMETVDKICPKRKEAISQLPQIMMSLIPQANSNEKEEETTKKLEDLFGEKGFEELRKLSENTDTIEQGVRVLAVLAKRYPLQLNDKLISELNTQVKVILNTYKGKNQPPFMLEPFLFLPWLMIDPEDAELSKEALAEFKMLERSLEL